MTIAELTALLATLAAYLIFLAFLAWFSYRLATDNDDPQEPTDNGTRTIQPRPPDRL